MTMFKRHKFEDEAEKRAELLRNSVEKELDEMGVHEDDKELWRYFYASLPPDKFEYIVNLHADIKRLNKQVEKLSGKRQRSYEIP